jgi:hypothetical protein
MDSVQTGAVDLALAIVRLLASETGSRAVFGALTLLSLFIGFAVDVAMYSFVHNRQGVVERANASTATREEGRPRHAPSDSSTGRKGR